MLKDIDEIKRQLQELASVVNIFKSEAVQLKIVELVFQHATGVIVDGAVITVRKSRTKKRKSNRGGLKTEKETVAKIKSPSKKSGRLGPQKAVNRLIEEGFFKEKRSIKNIIEYCSSKLATTIKANDISGLLARLVRDEKLDREKNEEKQYEYFTK